MQQKTIGQKKTSTKPQNNVLETLKNVGSGVSEDIKKMGSSIGTGAVDQLLGNYPDQEDYDEYDDFANEDFYKPRRETQEKPKQQRKEIKTLFNQNEYLENQRTQREIRELTDQLKQELVAFKNTGNALVEDIKEIEKITVETLPQKPGVYHIRFLEVLLSIVRSLRLKLGESKTWLEAMMTKKKKRGSLFVHLSKRKGTQYSLSQELQTARSVQ